MRPLPTPRWWGLQWPKRNASVVLSQNSRRLYNKHTKIHLQPASFPFPSSKVQPYARIGPVPATITAIKNNAAMLKACSMIRAESWTGYWHTVITESRGVYTCEMYQLILQISKRICCTPSCHDKQYCREEGCLEFIRWITLLGTGSSCQTSKAPSKMRQKTSQGHTLIKPIPNCTAP